MHVGSIAGRQQLGQARKRRLRRRLVRAAHEFEGQMMKELLEADDEGRCADGRRGWRPDSGIGSGGALGEFASEALGRR